MRFKFHQPNVVVEWFNTPAPYSAVPGFKTGTEIGYPDWEWPIYHQDDGGSPWWWSQYETVRPRFTSTRLHGVLSKKVIIFILAAVITWDLIALFRLVSLSVPLALRTVWQSWNLIDTKSFWNEMAVGYIIIRVMHCVVNITYFF
jgi:hypothetical protein